MSAQTDSGQPNFGGVAAERDKATVEREGDPVTRALLRFVDRTATGIQAISDTQAEQLGVLRQMKDDGNRREAKIDAVADRQITADQAVIDLRNTLAARADAEERMRREAADASPVRLALRWLADNWQGLAVVVALVILGVVAILGRPEGVRAVSDGVNGKVSEPKPRQSPPASQHWQPHVSDPAPAGTYVTPAETVYQPSGSGAQGRRLNEMGVQPH